MIEVDARRGLSCPSRRPAFYAVPTAPSRSSWPAVRPTLRTRSGREPAGVRRSFASMSARAGGAALRRRADNDEVRRGLGARHPDRRGGLRRTRASERRRARAPARSEPGDQALSRPYRPATCNGTKLGVVAAKRRARHTCCRPSTTSAFHAHVIVRLSRGGRTSGSGPARRGRRSRMGRTRTSLERRRSRARATRARIVYPPARISAFVLPQRGRLLPEHSRAPERLGIVAVPAEASKVQ